MSKGKNQFKFKIWGAFWVFLGVVILCSLGGWQVQRLAWKTDIIETIEAQLKNTPQIITGSFDQDEDWDYVRIAMRGVYLHGYEVQLIPRVLDGAQGAHVLTPFRNTNGDVFLVNRGFVSNAAEDKVERPEGIGTLNAILHVPDDRNRFTPPNISGSDRIYTADIKHVAERSGLEIITPYVAYAAADEGEKIVPIPGQLQLNIRNNHLDYAFFWFTMAGVLVLFYLIFSFKRSEER